jgi:hypothetical protein
VLYGGLPSPQECSAWSSPPTCSAIWLQPAGAVGQVFRFAFIWCPRHSRERLPTRALCPSDWCVDFRASLSPAYPLFPTPTNQQTSEEEPDPASLRNGRWKNVESSPFVSNRLWASRWLRDVRPNPQGAQ